MLLPSLTPGKRVAGDSYELPHVSILGSPEAASSLLEAPASVPQGPAVSSAAVASEADWPVQSVEDVFPSTMGQAGGGESGLDSSILSAASLFAAMGGEASLGGPISPAGPSEAGGEAGGGGGVTGRSVDGGGASAAGNELPSSRYAR